MPTRSLRAVAVAASLLFLVAACGADDDGDETGTDTTEAAAADFDAEAFCAAADVLGNSEAPTEAQLDAYEATAPVDLRDDVEVAFPVMVEALETGDFESLGAPAVLEATEAMRAAELEHCGVVAGEE